MGYEFVFRLPAGPVATAKAKVVNAEQVFTCLEQALARRRARFSKLRVPAPAAVTSLPHLSEATGRKMSEDVVVRVDSKEWYLNLHSATGAQQAVILQSLTQCLHTAGLVGKFEEL